MAVPIPRPHFALESALRFTLTSRWTVRLCFTGCALGDSVPADNAGNSDTVGIDRMVAGVAERCRGGLAFQAFLASAATKGRTTRAAPVDVDFRYAWRVRLPATRRDGAL